MNREILERYEQEKVPFPLARIRLELLKNELFQRQEGWAGYIGSNGSVKRVQERREPPFSARTYLPIQFLGVAVEALIGNREDGERVLKTLKERFAESTEKKWNVAQVTPWSLTSLSALLAEVLTGTPKEKVQAELGDLSRRCCNEEGLWLISSKDSSDVVDLTATLVACLLNVAMGREEEAGRVLGTLMKNYLPISDQLLPSPLHGIYYPEPQLLILLLEGLLNLKDPEEIKKAHERLKNSSLYDKQREYWREWVRSSREVPRDQPYSSLASLIEILLIAMEENPTEFRKRFVKE